MARTKQRRRYLPYAFPAVTGTHLQTRKDGWFSKPRPREGAKSSCWPTAATQPPVASGTGTPISRSLVQHANHYSYRATHPALSFFCIFFWQ